MLQQKPVLGLPRDADCDDQVVADHCRRGAHEPQLRLAGDAPGVHYLVGPVDQGEAHLVGGRLRRDQPQAAGQGLEAAGPPPLFGERQGLTSRRGQWCPGRGPPAPAVRGVQRAVCSHEQLRVADLDGGWRLPAHPPEGVSAYRFLWPEPRSMA